MAASIETILDLPTAVVSCAFQYLSAKDLAICMSICSLWRDIVPELLVWESHVRKRWRHWDLDKWKQLRDEGRWKVMYDSRMAADAEFKSLLAETVWPQKRHRLFRELHAAGTDALDVLHDAAGARSITEMGGQYRGTAALRRVNSLRCADSMRRLVADPDFAIEHIEEGAIILVQAHRPQQDVTSELQLAMAALRAELQRRVSAATPSTPRQMLTVLNEMLFKERQPGAGPRLAADRTLIMPSDGFGLGLQGNRDEYYLISNSLLEYVFEVGQGLPITLAVLHMALGRSIGLPIMPVNMPKHFMLRMGEEGSPDVVFIDAFDAGRVMNRAEVSIFMAGMDIPYNEQFLQPASAAAVYARMCLNMLHHHQQASCVREVPDLLLAALPTDRLGRSMRAVAAVSETDFDAALEDAQLLEGGAIIAARIEQRKATVELLRQKQNRREANPAVLYRTGQVIRHARYGYMGIITGWDSHCDMTEGWMVHMNVDDLPGGRQQPFYHVVVDERDRPGTTTYVAQINVEALEGDSAYQAGLAFYGPQKSDAGEVLEGLWPGESQFRLTEWGRYIYPDD